MAFDTGNPIAPKGYFFKVTRYKEDENRLVVGLYKRDRILFGLIPHSELMVYRVCAVSAVSVRSTMYGMLDRLADRQLREEQTLALLGDYPPKSL